MDSQADQQGVCVLGADGWGGWGTGGVDMGGVGGWGWRVSKNGKELGG